MSSDVDAGEPWRPSAVRFFAGHGGSPLWSTDPDHPGPIDPEALGLSSDLAARIVAWDGEITRRVAADQENPGVEHLLCQHDGLAFEVQRELWDVEVLVGDDQGGWHPIRG